MPEKDTIECDWNNLDHQRTNSLERKRECAALTIPGVLPPLGFNETQELEVPYSSAPARMVDSLSAKLVDTTIPLNNLRYFELEISDTVERDMDPTELIKKTAGCESSTVAKLNATNMRQMVHVVFQHLVITGDCLLCMYDNGSFQAHRIDNYVVERYGDGRIYRIILREWVNKNAIPEELKGLIKENESEEYSGNSKWEPAYTSITYNGKTWDYKKEFRGKLYESGNWKVIPYWAVRWEAVANEAYGRSLCEKNIGDLRKLHGISKAIIDGIAVNAEFRWGVDPAGLTEVMDLVDSDNCSFVPARQADLFPIQANGMVDVKAMFEIAAAIEKSLAMSFLMETAAQPHQERVTAAQIRSIGSEFSSTLNGVLSIINTDMMQGIIRRKLFLDQASDPQVKVFMDLIDNDILNIKIRTGLEALGREMENSQIGSLVTQAAQLPPAAQEALNWTGIVTRLFASTGINTTGLILSPQEQDQIRQQRMQEQLMASGVQSGVDAAAQQAVNKQ